jgi:HEAT repeat protein
VSKPVQVLGAYCLCFALVVRAAEEPAAAGLKWHDDVKSALAEAMKGKKPILLIVGAEWCGPCKVLEKEMARPEVAGKLGEWTLVHLDVDHSAGAAAWLESGAIPLLRLLSPTGKRVAVREGAMKGEDLVQWLDAQRDAALASAGEELLGSGEPTADDLAKLVKRLGDADPTPREAAIKRMLAHPGASAGAVVDAFAKGDLATRLAALDLLEQWKAPVTGIDPWRPETVTNDAIKKLLDWAATAKSAPATRPASRPTTLPSADVEDARREIGRMLAGSDEEARAARERLARYGRALMPEVLAALKEAATDLARERLLALRYRLVAPDALVLQWPNGIERLAATDPAARRGAAEELVKRGRSDDGALMLELFSDPDPLVREISLRGLQSAGGGDAGRALLNLLNDPDLNVRAAVLKQLAEAPSTSVVSAVVSFAQKEKDSDLVVHAARVLREVKGERAIDGLLSLLSHPSWRVRAEAAEALIEMGKNHSSPAMLPKQADVYAAMIKLLDDPDAFVVSRAVLALQQADTPLAVEPMAQAAAKHPELTAEIIKAMTQGNNTKRLAEKHLRQFCSHADPMVRAEAIAGLCTISGEVEKEMTALLSDSESWVRGRAAAALFDLMQSWRPQGQTRTRVERSFFGLRENSVQEKVDPWQWTTDFQSGKGERPAWILKIADKLDAMTRAKEAEERLDAARALAALRGDAGAAGVIVAAAREKPALASKAAAVLPWLAIDKRLEVFNALRGLARDEATLYALAESMASVADPKAAMALWEMLGDKAATPHSAAAVYQALQKLYFGERYYDLNSAPAKAREELASQARKFAAEGSEMQRVVGLATLLYVSTDEVIEPAKKTYEDAKLPEALRSDALQILLLAQKSIEGTKTAAAALGAKEPAFKRVAARYLSSGAEDLSSVRESLYLRFNNPEVSRHVYVSQGTPIILEPPPGIKPEMLKPLLRDPDGETAACAGYLLALLGEREGLDAVVRHWRAHPRDENARRLTYRAIAAMRDDQFTPILEEIYKSYNKEQYYVREFYWTIRVIAGEKALLLRKKIRDEMGMDNLR